MAFKTYTELLRHPNWQRKRLEVLTLAQFACEHCGDKETTLNVHHGYYEKGKKPREYPLNCFTCLCEPCHEKVQEILATTRRQIGTLDRYDVQRAAGYLAMLDAVHPDDVIDAWTTDFVQGMADYLGVRCQHLLEELDNCMTYAEILKVAEQLPKAPEARLRRQDLTDG